MLGTQSRWLTAREAAQRIGVHKDDIYKLVKQEGLPAKKITTGRLRINEDELHEWMISREAAS